MPAKDIPTLKLEGFLSKFQKENILDFPSLKEKIAKNPFSILLACIYKLRGVGLVGLACVT